MKKILTLLTTLILSLALSSCNQGKGADLVVLSWGEYISDDVIKEFEELNNVSVKVVSTDSNESMYTMIQNKTSEYDIAIPSDYMIHQMMVENMIYKLDYSLLPNYNDSLFVPELKALMDGDDMIEYDGYYVPYFWGSLGIMYSNKRISNMGDIVKEVGMKIFYEEDLRPEGCKIAMYNGSRDALASAEIYLGYSLNTKDHNEIDAAMNLIKSMGFETWGTDDLKIDVSKGNIDVALVYTGDYFDVYYSDMESGNEANLKTYGIYSPEDHNNIFLDAMVIPKTSSNVSLAHSFINHMISYDASYENASYVGYCPTIKDVYNDIMVDEDFEDVVANRAYSPVNILKNKDSIGEVYRFLGSDTFRYIEKRYTEVLF